MQKSDLSCFGILPKTAKNGQNTTSMKTLLLWKYVEPDFDISYSFPDVPTNPDQNFIEIEHLFTK